MQYYSGKIIAQKKIAPAIYLLEVASPTPQAQPGQFFMIKGWKYELPMMRPISIFKVNQESYTFLYKVVGEGTAKLSQMKKGETIQLLGPLGNGFPCDQVKGKIALVGGGVGIPPMYETAKRLTQTGNTVDLYLGYKEDLFCFEDFADVCNRIFIACESGNEGYKGFITDLLQCQEYDAVFTCGPEAMMLKIRDNCLKTNTPVWLSMEKRMGCGIGACLVCSCQTIHGMQRCCKDGPVFDGKKLKIENDPERVEYE